jgi:VIT1/CCC1 family predicted Fe2+/Mn2+ transporter
MNLVHNERVKLLASLLNAMAGSSYAVGAAAPLAAAIFYSPGKMLLSYSYIVVGIVLWIVLAALFHLAAWRVMKGLRE